MEQLIEANQALRQELDRERAARLAASTPGITFDGDTWHSYQSVIRGLCVAMFFEGVRGVMMPIIEYGPPGSSPSVRVGMALMAAETYRREVVAANRSLEAHRKTCIELRGKVGDLEADKAKLTAAYEMMREANRLLSAKNGELREHVAALNNEGADPRWIARVKTLESRNDRARKILEGGE